MGGKLYFGWGRIRKLRTLNVAMTSHTDLEFYIGILVMMENLVESRVCRSVERKVTRDDGEGEEKSIAE